MRQQFILFMMTLLPMVASADDSGNCSGDIDNNVTWTYVESTQTLTISGSGSMGEYGFFPDEDVYNFSDTPWSQYNDKIQKVIIKSGVTSIGGGAFRDCINLTTVTLPSSLSSIRPCAFYGCSSLSSIILPNGLLSIWYSAFYGCNSLSSITIPSSVTYIEVTKYYNAFAGCSGLTSITVESGNQNYDSRNNCNAIIDKESNTLIAGCKNTIIPNDVTTIGIGAFSGRTNLTSMTIPNGVTTIGRGAFQSCASLSSITIPKTVTLIDVNAFNECTGLESVTIEGDVFQIADFAFFQNSKLKDMYFTGLIGNTFSIGSQTYWADDSPGFGNVTAYVPAAFLAAYPDAFFEYGYSKYGFKDLKTLDGSSGIPKCEKPVITFANGKLSFTCATPDVEFHWTITSVNGIDGTGVGSDVSPSFKVSVCATKAGYVTSDMETRVLDCNTGGLKGDLDGDGKVNAADHVKLSDIIMGK